MRKTRPTLVEDAQRIGPGLCSILDMDFRELLFYDVGELGQEQDGPGLYDSGLTSVPQASRWQG